ncbi:multiheme c-type cytochrome [Hydrogenimonas sp.]
MRRFRAPGRRVMLPLFAVAVLGANAYAKDPRIEEQLNASPPKIPLKYALGEKAFDKAMRSGKYYYVGNTKCRLCHRKFFLGRKKDPHDYAMKSLKEGGYDDNPKCLPCHSTGYGVPNGFKSMKETPRLANVQCEGCHGPGNRHVKIARKTKKGGGFLAGADNPKVLERMCKSCHTERWNRSYTDFHTAYKKYKNADPNKKKKIKTAGK